MKEDIFADEWRECLRAHYMHVIRTRDKVTEPSLTVVMHQAGFDTSELAELRVRATMHQDDVGADFVPDLEILEDEARVIAVGAPEPAEQLATQGEVPVEAEALIEAVEEAAAEAELLVEEPLPEPPDEPDAPQQLTLF
jgi:hypothetical protein